MPFKRLVWPLMGFGSVAAVWVAAMFPPGWERAPVRPSRGGGNSVMPAFACSRSSCAFHRCDCSESTAPDEYPQAPGCGQRRVRRSCDRCCALRSPPPGRREDAPAPATPPERVGDESVVPCNGNQESCCR